MEDGIVVDRTKAPAEIQGDSVAMALWESEELQRLNDDLNKTQTVETVEETETIETVTKFEFTPDELKEYGEFKTPEEIKEALKDRSLTKAERDALKQNLVTLTTELNDTKTKLEAKPKTSFKDKDLYRLDKIKSEKPENFELMVALKYGKQSPMDILRAKFIKDNPQYKDKPFDMIEDIIRSDYFPDENLDPEVPEDKKRIDRATMKMELAADKAKAEILAELEAITVPETEIIDEAKLKADQDNLKAQSRNVWTKIIPELGKGLSKYPIRLPETDEKGNIIKDKFKTATEYSIPENILAEAQGAALEYMADNMLITNDEKKAAEYMQTANNIMMQYIKNATEPQRNLIIANHARSLTAEEYHKLYHNPSGGQKPPKKPAERTDAQKTYDEAKERYINR